VYEQLAPTDAVSNLVCGRLAGPNAIVTPTGPSTCPGPNCAAQYPTCTGPHAGLLATGHYLTDPNFWKCPSSGLSITQATFDYTMPDPIYKNPYDPTGPAGPLDSNGMLPVAFYSNFFLPGDPVGDVNNGNIANGHRKITTFPGPSHTVVLAEENTGMVPGSCGRSDTSSAKINDPLFRYQDETEPRHVNASTAGCLDGHVIIIPSSIQGCTNRVYTYSEDGPKQVHRMPQYCPFQ
jgi:hypothetical protein